MKKLIKSLLALLMVAALALTTTACRSNNDDEDGKGTFNPNGELKDANVKVGLI